MSATTQATGRTNLRSGAALIAGAVITVVAEAITASA